MLLMLRSTKMTMKLLPMLLSMLWFVFVLLTAPGDVTTRIAHLVLVEHLIPIAGVCECLDFQWQRHRRFLLVAFVVAAVVVVDAWTNEG